MDERLSRYLHGKTVNAATGGVGMLIEERALKSINSIEEIQSRMMVATFNDNALLRNHIEPKIEKIIRKNQNGFRRNRSTTSQILTIRRILEGDRVKNPEATILFVDFSKAFDSILRGEMEQILLTYDLPKETVAAIIMLYKNTKVKVCSPDGGTDYFNIVSGVLQGDTLVPYLFIICLDYVHSHMPHRPYSHIHIYIHIYR